MLLEVVRMFVSCSRRCTRIFTGWTLQYGCVEVSGAISRADDVHANVVSSPVIKSFGQILLIIFVMVGISVVFSGLLLNEWKQNPNQRSWFLFGSAFYVLSVLKCLWSELVLAWSQSSLLQISVDRRSSSTLCKRYADAVVLGCSST